MSRTSTSKRAPRVHNGLTGISSSAGAGILALVGGIALLPLIISTVGSGPYGVWLVLSAVATYLQYSDLGVGAAIVHFGSRARAGDNARNLGHYLSAGLLWNSTVAVVAIPVYIVASAFYLQSAGAKAALDPAEIVPLLALGSLMLAGLVIRPFSSALTGSGLLPLDRRNQGIGVLVRIAATVAACLLTHSVLAVAAAETLAALVPSVLAVIAVLGRRLAVLRWDRHAAETLRFMFSYSLRSFGVSAVGALILQAGTVVAGLFLGPSSATYFNAAFRIYNSARQLMTWMVDPFRSALSRLFTSRVEEAKEVLFGLAFVALAAAAVGSGVLIFGSFGIVQLWLGARVPVAEVALATIILLLGFVINSVQIPLVPAGDAIGRPGVFFWIQALWLASFLILGPLLAKPLDIVGVALALSAPLLYIVPLYLRRARLVLGFTLRQWFRRVGTPVVVLVLPGVALAGLTELACVPLGWPHLSFPSAAAFLVGVVASALLLRRRIPLSDVISLLRTEL
jgi:O-antigen/teichoic acid export membrane protein